MSTLVWDEVYTSDLARSCHGEALHPSTCSSTSETGRSTHPRSLRCLYRLFGSTIVVRLEFRDFVVIYVDCFMGAWGLPRRSSSGYQARVYIVLLGAGLRACSDGFIKLNENIL